METIVNELIGGSWGYMLVEGGCKGEGLRVGKNRAMKLEME